MTRRGEEAYIASVAARSNLRARRNRSCTNIQVSLLSLDWHCASPGLKKKKTYQGQGIKTLCVALGLEGDAQLLDLLILLRRQVARVAVGLDGSHEGEVKVVVFGVELHASGVGGSSHVDKFPGQRENGRGSWRATKTSRESVMMRLVSSATADLKLDFEIETRPEGKKWLSRWSKGFRPDQQVK